MFSPEVCPASFFCIVVLFKGRGFAGRVRVYDDLFMCKKIGRSLLISLPLGRILPLAHGGGGISEDVTSKRIEFVVKGRTRSLGRIVEKCTYSTQAKPEDIPWFPLVCLVFQYPVW